ncbi:MAG: hypothetical protein M3Z36_06960, partial [Acidobacteriota bacterium]|nr:hypothetical protein [Acidobacteriota bacterium]
SAVHGREPVLELGSGKIILLRFRVSAIEGWKVEKALVLLHVSGSIRPRKALLAPIASRWSEAAANSPTLGKEVEADERTRPDGWISIDLPIDLVQTLVDGKAYGIAIRLDGETGQQFDSRETVQFSPYLVVQGVIQGKQEK